jgi:hypothetical protein
MAPDPFNADTSGALDALVTAKKDEASADDGAKPKPADDSGAKPKPADDSGAKPDDSAAAVKPAKPADTEPTLPAGASPKSHEAFAAIKARAVQDLEARDKEIEALKVQVRERDEKLRSPVPKELADEVAELRKFRAKFDIEADPKFGEFDKAVNSAKEFVYDQLKKSPAITEDIIAAIKKHGGPEFVKMDKIFSAMQDPSLQRVIEIKLTEIESAKFAKQQAIKTAKDNVDSYLKERAEAFEKSVNSHTQATEAEFNALAPNLAWLEERKPDPKASDKDADAKSVKEHNDFVAKVKGQLAEATHDDSPRMRAILLAGFAQLLNTQRALTSEKETSKSLKTQVEELTGKLTRFNKAGRLNKDDTGASPAAQTVTKREASPFNTNAGDALDAIKATIAQEQARKQA